MVNRRTLRSKAVKGVYAYENCQQANYQLALDRIEQDFARDLNSMEEYDEEKMNGEKKHSRQLLDFYVEGSNGAKPTELSSEAQDSGTDAFNFLKTQNNADKTRLQKDIFREFSVIGKIRFKSLLLLLEFGNVNRELNDEKRTLSEQFGQSIQLDDTLYNNQVIQLLLKNEKLQEELSRNGINWTDDKDMVITWYKNVLLKDDAFKEYNRPVEHSYEEDWEMVDHIMRNIIFKHEAIDSYFEKEDLDWLENKAIVRSLTLKSLKSIKDSEDFQLAEMSYNWEEDSDFLKLIYEETIKENDYFEALIRTNSKNWDLERIAIMDRVIIKTALSEMINFPSIPVKVSINEYLEIAKTYSTPKSKNFVNGMLDVISGQLIEEGKIRKSGRGLLDNK